MKSYIYGIFSGERCLYVGRTRRLKQRAYQHLLVPKSRFYAMGAILLVLEEVDKTESPNLRERFWISRMSSLGQARFNRAALPKPLKQFEFILMDFTPSEMDEIRKHQRRIASKGGSANTAAQNAARAANGAKVGRPRKNPDASQGVK